MPKLDLTTDDVTTLMNCVDTELKSAKRAQNTGKSPQIREVYATHQRTLEALMHKIAASK